MKKVNKVVEYVLSKHTGQYRDGKGDLRIPYMIHLLDGLRQLFNWGLRDKKFEYLWIAYLNHDNVEDTDTTIDEVRELFGSQVADIVHEMTWYEDIPKEEYIESFAGKSIDALLLKITDRICNIADAMASSKSMKRAKKLYTKGTPLWIVYGERHSEMVDAFGPDVTLEIGHAISTFASILAPDAINTLMSEDNSTNAADNSSK